MNRRLALALGGLGLAAAAGAVFLLSRPAPVAPPPPAPSALLPAPARSPAAAAAAALPAAAAAPVPVPAALPPSLRDTEPDGALRVDRAGDLVVSAEVRAFFEYFLAATGEEPEETLRARILATIAERLPPRAAAQAAALLDRYLAYRDAARTLAVPEGPGGKELAARIEAVRRLRREKLGPEVAAALFTEDEAVETVALERARLAADTSLSPGERELREGELEELLPDRVREARAPALTVLQQQKAEEALRARGASPEELHRHRVAAVGEEAAARLDALDREDEEWRRRLEAYRARRRELERSGLSDGARRQAVEELLSRSFSPPERLRVEALDPLDAAAGTPAR